MVAELPGLLRTVMFCALLGQENCALYLPPPIVGKRTAWREKRGYCVGPKGGVWRCGGRLRHALRIAMEVAGTEAIRVRKWQHYYHYP